MIDDLSHKLLHLRQLQGLTQAELAGKLSVNVSTLAHWEQQRSKPTGLYRQIIEDWLTGGGAIPGLAEASDPDDDFSPHRLKSARLRSGLSRPALARMLGIRTPTICRWEHGDRLPNGLYRKLIARFLCAVQSPPDSGPVSVAPMIGLGGHAAAAVQASQL